MLYEKHLFSQYKMSVEQQKKYLSMFCFRRQNEYQVCPVLFPKLLTQPLFELKIAFQWQGEALAAGDLSGHNFISGRFSYFSHPGRFKSQTLAIIHQIGLCCPSELFWKKFHAIHTQKKHRMQASSSDDSMWWFSNIWSSPIDTLPKWSNM